MKEIVDLIVKNKVEISFSFVNNIYITKIYKIIKDVEYSKTFTYDFQHLSNDFIAINKIDLENAIEYINEKIKIKESENLENKK